MNTYSHYPLIGAECSFLSSGSRRLADLGQRWVMGPLLPFLPTPVISNQFERVDRKRQEWKVGMTHLWERFSLGFLSIVPWVFLITLKVAGNTCFMLPSHSSDIWWDGSHAIRNKQTNKNHGEEWLHNLTKILYCFQFRNQKREKHQITGE